MKALSLKQPWAWLVFHGKDIENRKWPTKYRGPLLIHASKGWDSDGERWLYINVCKGNIPIKEIPMRHDPRIKYGAIIGKVVVADCVNNSSSPWFFGPYGFVLGNPIEFDKPIPCKGMLGFFEVLNGEC